MPNELHQEGFGNFGFQDIRDLNFTIFIGKSYEYKELMEQLEVQKKLLNLTENSEDKLNIEKKINELKVTIDQFKRDVLQLTTAFDKIDIETERLKQVRSLFGAGKISEAREILTIELKRMQKERVWLIQEQERYEKEILPGLKNNSEEFYILALTTQMDYDNSNRIDDASRYFDLSIENDKNTLIRFSYAYFLAKRDRLPAIKFKRKKLNELTIVLDL